MASPSYLHNGTVFPSYPTPFSSTNYYSYTSKQCYFIPSLSNRFCKKENFLKKKNSGTVFPPYPIGSAIYYLEYVALCQWTRTLYMSYTADAQKKKKKETQARNILHWIRLSLPMNTYIIYVIYREKSNQIVQRDKRDQGLAKLNTTLNTLPAGTGCLQRDKRVRRWGEPLQRL